MSNYIWPSRCGQCVAVETIVTESPRGSSVTHISHQTECPNHPEATR